MKMSALDAAKIEACEQTVYDGPLKILASVLGSTVQELLADRRYRRGRVVSRGRRCSRA